VVIADRPCREVRVNFLGYLAAGALLTVMVTGLVAKLLPALSVEEAVSWWVVFVRVWVFRGWEMELWVVVAKGLPSTSRVKVFRPEVTCPGTVGSEAEAEKVMVPETVPWEGEVMEAVGGVVSGFGLTVTVAWAVAGLEPFVAVKV